MIKELRKLADKLQVLWGHNPDADLVRKAANELEEAQDKQESVKASRAQRGATKSFKSTKKEQ